MASSQIDTQPGTEKNTLGLYLNFKKDFIIAMPDDKERSHFRHQPQQHRSQQTQQKILDAALTVIDSQGISALSTRNIAKAADVSAASIYRYFSDKDAIINALLQRWYDGIIGIYKDFDNEMHFQLGWEKFFKQIDVDFLNLNETNEIYQTLSNHVTTNKLSIETNKHHYEKSCAYYIKFLKRFGSTWPDDELKNVILVMMHCFDGVMANVYYEQQGLNQQAYNHFQTMYLSLIEKTLTTDQP